MLYIFNTINLILYLLIFPIKCISEGKDSTLVVKRNLISFEISKKTIINSNLLNQKSNLTYCINYEKFINLKRNKIFYVGLGANLLYNHCYFNYSDSPPSIHKINFNVIGTRLTTSLNFFQKFNNNISFLFRVNPYIGPDFILYYKSFYFINDTLSFNHKGYIFNNDLKGIYSYYTFLIYGVNTEYGIIKKITKKHSLLINVGINVNNHGFSKISIITRIVEPIIRIGIFL